MDIELFREYCVSKKCTTEEFPFDEDTLVFKVCGKMFALISVSEAEFCLLKNTPEKCIELREQYSQIQPGYHMNKTHWNSVYFDGLPDSLIFNLVDVSYNLVVNKLPKKLRNEII